MARGVAAVAVPAPAAAAAANAPAAATGSGKPPCLPTWILASLKRLLRLMFDNPLKKPTLHISLEHLDNVTVGMQ